MKTIRTFTAVEVSPDVRQRAGLLVQRLQRSSAEVRWVDLDQYHITLNFLGDVPNDQVYAVCQAVSEACEQTAPFVFDCTGAGAFPNIEKPRTLWLGVKEGSEGLARLQANIAKALEPLHLNFDARRFHPHITLGRVRRLEPDLTDILQKNADFEAGNSFVDEALVFSSVLEKSGPRYDVMGRADLTGESEV